MRPKRAAYALLLCLPLLAAAGGCGEYGYEVWVVTGRWARQPSPAGVPTPRRDVHLIGVSERDFETWSKMSVTKYWRELADKEDRDLYVFKMKFGPDEPVVRYLPKTHPIWRKWEEKGKHHLFVLASWPPTADKPGSDDPRRIILPMRAPETPLGYPDEVGIQFRSTGMVFMRPRRFPGEAAE